MAEQNIPWSVKGVSPLARQIARESARKEGTTIGAWLTQLIEQSLQKEQAIQEKAAANSNAEAIEERIGQVEKQVTEAYSGLLRAMEKANKRIAELENVQLQYRRSP